MRHCLECAEPLPTPPWRAVYCAKRCDDARRIRQTSPPDAATRLAARRARRNETQ